MLNTSSDTKNSEKSNILNLVKNISQKKYSEANKYLQEVVNSKLKNRIEAAAKNKLY